MASFEVRKHHQMAKGELKQAAGRLAEKLEARHGVSSRWDGDTVCIEGSGVRGRLTLGDDEVVVSVKLNLVASAFQGRLKSEVERYLDQYVA